MQRRLNNEKKKEIGRMIEAGCNKKRLQSSLAKEGQTVILKDLHNLSRRVSIKETDQVETVINMLKMQEGGDVFVYSEESSVRECKEVVAIAYQDKNMKDMFSSFPEVLFIDATYRLNNLDMPLFLLVSEDANGESEIVGIWLTKNEQKQTLQRLVQAFKERNPKWTETRVIITDKDASERGVFSQEMNVDLQLCLYHVLKVFKREMNGEMEKEVVLKCLHDMIHAANEKIYMQSYTSFKQFASVRAIDYFNKNWHPIRNQWVVGLKSSVFNNNTNNRVESINQKLKSVINKNSTIVEFFQHLLDAISCFNIERDHRALNVVYKRTNSMFSVDSPEYEFAKHLTPFALNLVCKEIKKAKPGMASSMGCNCLFHRQFDLPCRHIFEYRKSHSLPLFSTNIVARRWTLSYYKSNHRALRPCEERAESNLTFINDQPASLKVLSQSEKYNLAQHVSKKKLMSFHINCRQ